MQVNFQELAEKYSFSQEIIELFWKKYSDRTEKILQALKEPSSLYSIRVNTLKSSASEVLNLFQSMNIKAIRRSELEEVILLPVQGPFPVPEYNKKIVADKFAAESLIQGADLFAPGVLRAKKVQIGDKVTIIDKFDSIIASGIAQMKTREMLERKHGLAVQITDSKYKNFNVRQSQLFKDGFIFDQSFPSILVSKILEPKSGENILDLCAAPGGKTTHIAQLLQNTGHIVAVDRSKPRLKRLEEHIDRLGVTNIEIISGDARKLPDRFHQWADRVLVDPPCSALGVRPKLYDNTIKKDIKNAANYQRHFLRSAVQYVKPQGVVVYCTCTLTTEENEANIKFFVDNFNCKIIDQPFKFGSPGEEIANLPNWQKLQRFFPDTHDTPGYFIAKMKMLE
ncbi:MAG: PUA domain-containing protein [Candidatus Helarchaeota archaeon]